MLRGLTARSGSTAATSSPVMSPAATVFNQSEPEMLCRDRGLEGRGLPPPPARQCHPARKPWAPAGADPATGTEWPCTGPYPHGALARGHEIGLEAQIPGVDVVDPTEPVPAVEGTE